MLLGLLCAAVLFNGCDSDAARADSHIRIRLTDAPFEDIVEANVVIERIELLGEGEKVVLLADDPQPFDLLTLQDGVTVTLADLEIPDGTYHQVRLVVNEEANVVFDDGTSENLKVPSGTQTGIKIPLPALMLSEDFVDLTVDFDVSQSFVKRGNSGKGYIFKPVLKPVSLVVNGDEMELDEAG